jgi:hypothetical protein
MTANTAIVTNTPLVEESAEQLLAARDAIVVRCLLTVVRGGGDSHWAGGCSMTTSFVRWLISSRSGLVGLLVKQGLEERDLDWLVENVPETMNDSHVLLQIVSERSSLTAAERLVAADAVIRIAIVHGHSKDTEAAQLSLSALSQLVDSFFLVLGPVGVPVNALLNDDSGTDITQICRKAAFRILKALQRITGRRSNLRKECGIVLQKLAALCKGESAVAGVLGLAAGRRKQLVKDIYDATVKAGSAMGVSVGTQSATV